MMADDFLAKMANPPALTEKDQKRITQAIAGDMGDEHKNFLTTITGLLDRGEIDVYKPETFLNKDTYDKLDEEWKGKTDVALVNIADLLRHIAEFYKSAKTPPSSPHLQTMIEQLWDMKQRIEQHADVFKF